MSDAYSLYSIRAMDSLCMSLEIQNARSTLINQQYFRTLYTILCVYS